MPKLIELKKKQQFGILAEHFFNILEFEQIIIL